MTDALADLLAERAAVVARLAEIRAVGHHRGEWVRRSNPPPETRRRLMRAAQDAIDEQLETLAKFDEQLAQPHASEALCRPA